MSVEFDAYWREYEKYRPAIEALRSIEDLEKQTQLDPYGIYLRLSEIEKIGGSAELTAEGRTTAVSLVESALSAALAGNTEPNTLFNTAMTASRLDFDIQATKLMSIAFA